LPKADSLANAFVLQCEGLSISAIMDFLESYPEVSKYWPGEKELAKVCRSWIIKVAATRVGEDFKQWVAKVIRDRNERIKL
jgi:hypothetical protein